LRTGKDGYITLKASQRHYIGSELFEQGLRIPITYDELVKFLSFDNLGDLSTDALFTIGFQYRASGEDQMSPRGYSLDINQFWGINKEEISVKAAKTFNTIINTFTQQNLGTELYNKEFSIKLLVDRGKGVSKSPFTTRYKRYGITEYIISFTPNDPRSLKNAIASMITYLYAFPDTFTVIKQGFRNFLFADIYNIHTPEYVAESDYSGTVGGTFMWDQNGEVGLTRENYDNLIVEYSNNFNDRDIRFLLGFSNEDIVSLILSKFQTMFNEQVDQHINIIDLRR